MNQTIVKAFAFFVDLEKQCASTTNQFVYGIHKFNLTRRLGRYSSFFSYDILLFIVRSPHSTAL